jgi:hypothetical protein
MNSTEVLVNVQQLGLPADSYVVFGSAPMVMAGLRETDDIDLFVTEPLFEQLAGRGWEHVSTADGTESLRRGVFEAFTSWQFGTYAPQVAELLGRADPFGGVPFASLRDVKKWKTARGREKDLRDCALIDTHLSNTT